MTCSDTCYHSHAPSAVSTILLAMILLHVMLLFMYASVVDVTGSDVASDVASDTAGDTAWDRL